MLEVHELMHGLEKQQLQTQSPLDVSPEANTASSVVSLDTAIRDWLEDETRFQKQHNSEMAILDAVADKLLGSGSPSGASLLCFDEVQARTCIEAL